MKETESPEEPDRSHEDWIFFALVLFLLAVSSVVVYAFYKKFNVPEEGGVARFNAVVSAFASVMSVISLIVVLYTIRMQRKEMRYQRAEMVNATRELKNQVAVLGAQHRYQNFATLQDSIQSDYIDQSIMLYREHFNPDVYQERYKGKRNRIIAYLYFERAYVYLISVLKNGDFPKEKAEEASNSIADSELSQKINLNRWIKMVFHYHEFVDVHDEVGEFYPDLKEALEKERPDVPKVEMIWVSDE